MHFRLLILTVPPSPIPRCWGEASVVARMADILASLNLDIVVRQASTEAELRSLIANLRPHLIIPNGYRLSGDERKPFISEILETMGIPFLGSGSEGLSCISKSIMKTKLLAAGVCTPQALFVTGEQPASFAGLKLPVVLKPDEGAESMGIRVVENADQIDEAVVGLLSDYGPPVVVEEWQRQREFTVAVLGNDANRGVFPLELDVPDGYTFLTNEVKERFIGKTVRGCPDLMSTKQLQTLIHAACTTLSIFDWARLDVLQDEAGDFFIIDINPLPGLRFDPFHPSYFPLCLYHHLGFSYDDTIIALVGVALKRWGLRIPNAIALTIEWRVARLIR